MPAIPVYARLEDTLSDAELKAVHQLTAYLERSAVCGTDSGARSLFLDAANGDAEVAHRMLTATCSWHAAARRALDERNLPETLS